MPWNQSTIIGYFGDVCFMLVIAELFMFVHGVVSLLFISICLHHRAFCAVYRQFIGAGAPDNMENDGHKFICRLIRFHVLVKKLRMNETIVAFFVNFKIIYMTFSFSRLQNRLFSHTATVYAPFIAMQLICNVIIMAIIMFQVDLVIKIWCFVSFFSLS